MSRKLGSAFAVMLAAGAIGSAPASASDVIVQGTTDIRDAGLLNDVIVPGFQAKYPQYTLKYIAVGTGQAITNAEAGQGDALVTHAPTSEKPFVFNGFSYEKTGRAVFYSDYVIIGPSDDPAGVFASAPHDAASAFERIAAAGEAGNANFVSRGDNSGTNTQEKIIWGLTNVPLNSSHEPGDGTATGNPAWYQKAGLGQAATVQLAAQCPFAGGGCYDMTDRGTFNRLVANGTITNMKVVTEKNDAAARGGLNLLTNPFTAYAVNPAKIPSVNLAGARAFLSYLTSKGFQKILDGYPSTANPAFFPDAHPEITLNKKKGKGRTSGGASAAGALPKSVVGGQQLKVSGQLRNLLPGSPRLNKKQIVIERAVKRHKKGTVFKRVAKTRTKKGGKFTLSFRAIHSGKLRLRVPKIYPNLNVNPLIAAGSMEEQILGLGTLRVRQ